MRGDQYGSDTPITLEIPRPQLVVAATILAAIVTLLACFWAVPLVVALGLWLARSIARREEAIRLCRHDSASGDRCPLCFRRI